MLIAPYLTIGAVIALMFAVIWFTKMPKNGDKNHDINFLPTLRRIFSIDYYREGVIAQFFYVGVQIMCWTFIIQYGTRILMNEGMAEQEAEVTSQTFNIIAMAIFVSSRFICTYFLKYINAGALLGILAVVGACLTLGVIFIDGRAGLYCLVAISVCRSCSPPSTALPCRD